MKSSTGIGMAGTALFAVLALPVKTVAQQTSEDYGGRTTRYTIVDLGAVGPFGQPFVISNDGFIAGFADPQNGAAHAKLWFYSSELDISTPGLGGPNSLAFGVNNWGIAAGGAQTSNPDKEDFCGFNVYGHPASNACVGFVWRYGTMYALPTLGGPNGYADMINDRGEVVGYAETARKDPDCPVHHFKPVVWKDGKPHALLTPGDSYGLAAYINEKGQVVGASGTCGSTFNANTGTWLVENHPLRWDSDGTPHELGTFGEPGGLSGNHACAINNRGDAVGHLMLTSDPAGPFRAVRWPEGTDQPEDLGTLPGDVASLALSINDEAKVVGASFDANFNFRAIIWEHDVMTDLNKLVHSSSSLYLLLAYSINNRGEIAGYGATKSKKGEIHGFLAIPRERDHDDDAESDDPFAMPRPVLSDQARQLLWQQLARSQR